MPNLEIQNAFLDGFEEIFREMFTDNLKYFPLNEDYTYVSPSYEAVNKEYKESITMIGRVNFKITESPDVSGRPNNVATVTIPTKEFIKSNLPYLNEVDIISLSKGKFQYADYTLIIDRAEPQTFIAGIFHLVVFYCTAERKSSID